MCFDQLTVINNDAMICHLFMILMRGFVNKFPKFLLIWQILGIIKAKLFETHFICMITCFM